MILCIGILGCGETGRLEREINYLKADIKTAKEIEILRAERDLLSKKLESFETRPETNVAPITSE